MLDDTWGHLKKKRDGEKKIPGDMCKEPIFSVITGTNFVD